MTSKSSYSIRCIFQTLNELIESTSLNPDTKALFVQPSFSNVPIEISIVYFRAGYTPKEYPTPKHYATRILMEQSRAIKCPTIGLHLAGSKKIQELLTKPGVLERFLCDEERWGKGSSLDAKEIEELRESWVEMWGLDDEGGEGEEDGASKAVRRALGLVLKTQREGGGNNVFKEDIPGFIERLPPKERKAWSAMEIIVPPPGTRTYFLRSGSSPDELESSDVSSEVGIYGWAFFGGKDKKVVEEGYAGWLAKTKVRGLNEGGVGEGFAFMDSLILVDGWTRDSGPKWTY